MMCRKMNAFDRVVSLLTPFFVRACYAGGDDGGDSGDSGGDGGGGAIDDDSGGDGGDGGGGGDSGNEELPFGELPETYWDQKFGSESVNPDSRPLRPEVLEDISSDDELDEVISALGEDAFMTAEEMKKYGRFQTDKAGGGNGSGDGNDDDDDDDDDGGGDDSGGDDGDEDDDTEVADFLEKAGLTREQFQDLPEKTRELLVERHVGDAGKSGGDAKGGQKGDDAKQRLDLLLKDPTVAARVHELETGNQVVARKMPEFTTADLSPELVQKLELGDGDRQEVVAELNRLAKAKAGEIIAAERSIADTNAKQQRAKEEAWNVLRSVGAINKDLAAPETLKDGVPKQSDIDLETPFGKWIDWVHNKGVSVEQIKSWGTNALYAMYEKETGLDQVRLQNAVKDSKKRLLEKLANPETAQMKSMPMGKRSPTSGPQVPGAELSEDALVEELAAGKYDNFQRLCRLHEGNIDMLDRLERLEERAERKRTANGIQKSSQQSRGARRRAARRAARQQHSSEE